jgi:glyoxylase-like metal-dependent hydrolase (beta-lactamase superfamily II)
MTAPGHTPGNAILDITSDAGRLFYLGDLIHFPIEFTNPEYYKFTDVDPEQAVETRTRIISQLADSECLVFACHLPFPGLGRIKLKNNGFYWQPAAEIK